jgi:hypothetical protein
MPIVYDESEYSIPRGIVFFDQFDTNGNTQGEDDLGNVPGFTINIASENADHYSARSGIREKDQSTLVQIDRTAKMIVDNMSVENVGRWLSADLVEQSQTADPVVDELISVIPGKFYQLGRTSSNPAGNRNVTSVVVTDNAGTTTYVLGTDYNVDLVSGRLQILESGAIVAGNIKVDYSKPVKTWNQVKTGTSVELAGALRVISDNASGSNRDFYMPSVKMKPSGDFPVITSDTQYVTMEFDVEILTPENGSAIYLDDQPVAA